VLFWTGYVGEVHLPLAEQGPLGKAQLRTNSQWTINSSRMVTLDNRNDEYLLLIMALQPFSGSIVAFYQWHWLNVDGYIYSFHLEESGTISYTLKSSASQSYWLERASEHMRIHNLPFTRMGWSTTAEHLTNVDSDQIRSVAFSENPTMKRAL
jgi:hypothetical protein